MTRFRRSLLLRTLLVGACLLGGAVLMLRTPDTDREVMRARYGGQEARFADGPADLRVHYRDEGLPNGLPVVLIHGTAASLHTWEPLVERLEDTGRFLTFDQPGHGLTGAAADEDYSASGLARAVEAVAAAADVDRFVLGGNSMGGWVAWRYALAHPERVLGLILLDPAGAPRRPGVPPPPENLGFRLLKIRWLRPLILQITPRALIERSVRETVSVEDIVDDAMVDRYWELLRYPGNRRAAQVRADVDREPGMFDRISEIEAPTLVLWGEEDQVIDASAAATFGEGLPNAQVIVYEGIGHLPMEEAPDRVADDLRRFLAKVSTASRP